MVGKAGLLRLSLLRQLREPFSLYPSIMEKGHQIPAPTNSRRLKLLALFQILLIGGCSSHTSWDISTIESGNKAFNSSRLRYLSTQAHPPILFEMIKIEDQIESFISLTRFKFNSTDKIKIIFYVSEESFEDYVPVHEGAMRVRLTHNITEKLIQALQDGRKIAILVDGFEETLDPEQFSSSFSKFVGEGHFFQNLLKGRT
jgi:hypothetical protein